MARWLRLSQGWSLFWTLVTLTTLGAFCLPVAQGFSTESLRWGLHVTARSSAVLFVLAITASGAYALAPSPFTRWQRANRRMFGLAFAVSHFVHAGFIVAFSSRGPAEYAEALTPGMVVAGSIGYTLIALMAATSFRTTAALIGPRNWNLLHTVGAYWLCIQFIIAFGKRIAAGGPIYVGFVAMMLGALTIRIVAVRVAAQRARSLS